MKTLIQIAKEILNEHKIIDRILDKISEKGIESLTPEEKKYLDNNGKGMIPASGPTTVYVSEPYTGLYKIEHFPSLSNTYDLEFDCEETDKGTCESQPEMIEMLKNKNFKLIIDKILNNEELLRHKWNKDYDNTLYFHGIDFKGNFSSPIDVAYAQVSGDSYLYFVNSLEQFFDEYKTEEGWGVKNWKKL